VQGFSCDWKSIKINKKKYAAGMCWLGKGMKKKKSWLVLGWRNYIEEEKIGGRVKEWLEVDEIVRKDGWLIYL
jgi:hypothetical protein